MKTGLIEVIHGPMFAGKTSELIRQIELSMIAKIEILVFKPKIDNRYRADEVCTNNGHSFKSIAVEKSTEILNYVKYSARPIEKIFIDEGQFFDEEIIKVINYLTKNKGIDVTVTGLVQDFKGEPFGPLPKILSMSQRSQSLTAVCVHSNEDGSVCRKPAYFTQRIVNGIPAPYNSPTILVGGADSYTARCEEHWLVPGRPEEDL